MYIHIQGVVSIKYESMLKTLVKNDETLMMALKTVKSLSLKNWCIGAGVIRDCVWSHLHGQMTYTFKDIDVAYFDKFSDTNSEKKLETELSNMCSGIKWDLKNQANVHLWYSEKFGKEVQPLLSLYEAVGTWPETATSVGIYLDERDELQIIAPFGLEDLFNIVLRRNPKRVTPKDFNSRLMSKGLIEKWPLMKIVNE